MTWLSESEAEVALAADPRVGVVATVLAEFYGGSAERSVTGAVAVLEALEPERRSHPRVADWEDRLRDDRRIT